MSSTSSAMKLVLHYTAEGDVKIVPPDNDIMVVSINAAVEACCAFREQIRFRDQFDNLLSYLAGWVENHKSKMASAYLTTRDSGLLFLIEQKEAAYDDAINEALTELDLAIANDDDFNLIRLNVLALPRTTPEGIQSFLSPQLQAEYQLTHAD